MSDASRKNKADAAFGEPGLLDRNSPVSLKLRELYDSVQSEAIPDRFLDLLEKLDLAERNAKPGTSQ